MKIHSFQDHKCEKVQILFYTIFLVMVYLQKNIIYFYMIHYLIVNILAIFILLVFFELLI